MSKRIFLFIIGAVIILSLPEPGSGRAVSIECTNPQTVTFPFPIVQVNTAPIPICYRITVPVGASLLAVILERGDINHLFDVYLAEGSTSTFYEWDMQSIPAGIDKIASVTTPVGEKQIWSLAITSPERRSLSLQLITYDSAESTGTSRNDRYILYKIPDQSPVIGGQFQTIPGWLQGDVNLARIPGSQVTFPVQVVYHGKIRATFEWTGTATGLALSLYGAGQGNRPKNQASAETRLDKGKYRLELVYQVTNRDVDEGVNWRIQLVNVSGGTASGDLRVSLNSQMNPEELSPGKTRKGFLGEDREFLSYVLPVREGVRRLSISMTSQEGADFDLFVRRDLPILRGRSDWKSKTTGRKEQVIINNPASGLYYIQVKLSQGSGSFDLKAELRQ